MLVLALFYLSYFSPSYFTPAAVRADAAGNFYVAGTVQSLGLPLPPPSPGVFQPALAGRRNGYIAKYTAGGKLLWATYLGGKFLDSILALTLDAGSHVYVTGTTLSPDFPTTPGALSATLDPDQNFPLTFISKLSPNGDRLLYSALLGGMSNTVPNSLAVDREGRVTIVGTTDAPDFPVTAGALQTSISARDLAAGFIARLNPDGTALDYATLLPGSRYGEPTTVSVDDQGDAYVAGSTYATDFPSTTGLQPTRAGVGAWHRNNLDPWQPLRSLPSGGTAIAIHPAEPATIFIGGHRAISRSTDAGATWTEHLIPEFAGDVKQLVFDPLTPSTIYAVGAPSLMRSTDAGKTWAPFGRPIGASRLFIHPTNPQIFLSTIVGDALFRSEDGGLTYKQLSDESGAFYTGCTLLAGDLKNPGTFYMSKLNGQNSGLLRTKDSGVTWTRISLLISAALAIDPADSKILVFPGHLSTDGGATWEDTSSAPGTVSTLLPAPSAPRAFYAVTTLGLFHTIDGGRTWDPSSDGLQNLQLSGIALHPANPSSIYAVSTDSTDAFVMKLDPTGALAWSTLIGGAGADSIQTLALAPDNTIYVAGATASLDFPSTPNTLAPDAGAFVARLGPDGTALRFSTRYPAGPVSIAVTPTADLAIGSSAIDPVTRLYRANFALLSQDGKSLLDSRALPLSTRVKAIALNPAGRVAVAGTNANPLEVTPNAENPNPTQSFLALYDLLTGSSPLGHRHKPR